MNVELNIKEMLELGKKAQAAGRAGEAEVDGISIESRWVVQSTDKIPQFLRELLLILFYFCKHSLLNYHNLSPPSVTVLKCFTDAPISPCSPAAVSI